MMDLSSVIDASLALAGGVAVVMMGIGTLSSESTTAFAAPNSREESVIGEHGHAWGKAA